MTKEPVAIGITAASPTQSFFVDGCKVTIRYTKLENPCAVSKIKATLLDGIYKAGKGENLHK